MTYQEKIKYLWDNKEFEQAYNLTQDQKIKDLIDWVNKSGGIEHIPQGVIYSFICDNSYLFNCLQELNLKGNEKVILNNTKKEQRRKKKNEI